MPVVLQIMFLASALMALAGIALLGPHMPFNRPSFRCRKHGGIWFARAWRVRVNFSIARES